MSKAQEIEDCQEFVDEYENISDTLQNLYDDINNKELKKEVFELLSVLEEDYKQQKEEDEEFLEKCEDEEIQYMNNEFERSRL